MSNSQKKFQPVSFTVESYARIDKNYHADVNYPEGIDVSLLLKDIDSEGGIVVIFPPGFNYTQLEGNQGTGKSSWTSALLEATGNILLPNAINSIDQTKRFNFKTWGIDGNLYNIRGTKSDFVIERLETDPDTGEPIINNKGKQVKSEMKSPKTFIRQIVGPAGISPQWLKDMAPAEQITWLRGLYSLDQDVLKKEVEINQEHTTTYKARTKAGNDYDRYKTMTTSSLYYADQPKHDKYFKETSFESLEKEFEDIKVKYEEYSQKANSLKNSKEIHLLAFEKAVTQVETDITGIEDQIKALQLKLAEKHNEKDEKVKNLNDYKERIATGEKWMKENAEIKTKYDNLNTKIVEATEFKAKKQEWETMLENQKQMNHYENEYQRLTQRIDALNEAKAKLTELYSPKIEGFEVFIPDEEQKKHGLFYKGHPLIELSESELWEMATALWKELNVHMVFVENINSLGTGAIDMFNKFIERGGYIFATMMNRAEKNLKITFTDKIK